MPLVTTYPGVFGPYTPITFTRASSATFFDQTGVLQTAATNVPRLDYNPSTLAARGFLIEEARTNSIRNNTMQGAVAGTPGTEPTNWTSSTSGVGLTREIVGVGTENGITYIDVRFSGTPSSGTSVAITFEGTNTVSATAGQTWTASAYVKLQAGSFNNTATTINLLATDGTSGTESFNSAAITSTPAALRNGRLSITGTLAAALGTTHVQPRVRIGYTAGVAIDITLRIGLPQLEQGAFATSVIPTTTTAVTRAADVASVNTLSPWFNATSGTLFAQGILVGGTAGNFPFQATLAGSNPNTDVIAINWAAASSQMRGVIRVSNVNTMDLPAGPAKVAGNSFRSAVTYQLNNSNFATDGTVASDDTAVTLPTVQSLLIGQPAVFQSTASVWIQRITYYPRRLSNAELQTITTP